MDETLARARGLAHPFSEAQTLLFSAHLYQLLREPQAARARAEEALALCIEHGFEAYRTWCLLPRGWAEAQQGHAMEGIANIHEALDARHATGAKAVLPWFYTVLGEAYGRAGNVDDGLRAAEEALGWVQHNDEHLYAAEAYRQKGQLLLEQDAANAAEAEECFRRAMDIAHRQQAKSWELRAAMSITRLRYKQGNRHRPVKVLAAVYDWYSEGFDTADLRDAKALIAETG